jgi:glycosyltransferase involved in cell wall biosynthesis
VRNVHEYLQAADFFVFPTVREAFGISVIEAFACGLPVITTATGGIRDIVEDQESAIVIPVNDERALRLTLEKMLRGEFAVNVLAKKCRRVAVARFSEPQVLQLYGELITDLLHRNAGRGRLKDGTRRVKGFHVPSDVEK